jgi:hypothetical protein
MQEPKQCQRAKNYEPHAAHEWTAKGKTYFCVGKADPKDLGAQEMFVFVRVRCAGTFHKAERRMAKLEKAILAAEPNAEFLKRSVAGTTR